MSCRCGLDNIRAIRQALEMTQRQLADAISVTPEAIYYMERPPHRCLRRQTVRRLRVLCERVDMAARLESAHINIAWTATLDRTPDNQICQICGVPFRYHVRCPKCSVLLGVGHTWPSKHPNHCNCGAWIGPRDLAGRMRAE